MNAKWFHKDLEKLQSDVVTLSVKPHECKVVRISNK